MRQLLLHVFICALLCGVSTAQLALQSSNTSEPRPPSDLPGAADTAYNNARFEEAANLYRAFLQHYPKSIEAQIGLVRSLYRQGEVKTSLEEGEKFAQASPDAASLHTALGEVHFRRAELAQAEKEFQKAIQLDSNQARAYLGLAKVYDAAALHRMAYDRVQKAHELAPNDDQVQRRWLSYLSRKERIAALEQYLAQPHGEDAETIRRLHHALIFEKALGETASHSCKLARPVERTETPLAGLMIDARIMRGWGLKVRLNSYNAKFLIDTGASGLVMGKKTADKAGVVRISANEASGIGDSGPNTGYYGSIDAIQIGDLEFHDCIVRVSDQKYIADEDGLIGADVFSSYIVGLDFREAKLRLDPLPKRPNESSSAAKSLDTSGDAGNAETEKAKDSTDHEAFGASLVNAKALPKDRYVAPEMKDWTTVFRIGHMLMVPTSVDDRPRHLFVLDTGAFTTTFSKNLADDIGHVHNDYHTRVAGISGSVKNVYRTEAGTLQFGNLRQKNQDTVTLDLRSLSNSMGIEISGFLGFRMLNMLDVQIDYRDNLINFNYDPTKLGLPDWSKK